MLSRNRVEVERQPVAGRPLGRAGDGRAGRAPRGRYRTVSNVHMPFM